MIIIVCSTGGWSRYFAQVDGRIVYLTYTVNIHQQFGFSATHYISNRFFRLFRGNIMVCRNNRMATDLSGPFNYPIAEFLFIETACIANPSGLSIIALYFTPWIFPRSNSQYFIPPVP